MRDAEAGQDIEGYLLLRQLPFGPGPTPGFSRFVALSPRLREVVISIAEADARDQGQAFSEVEEARKIDSPLLAPLLAIESLGPEAYLLVEEFRPSLSLRHVLAGGRLTFDESAKLLWRLAAALMSLHGNGLTHGLLRPEHLSFDLRGNLIVGGWLPSSTRRRIQATLSTQKIRRYDAPELTQEGLTLPTGDIYSYGLVFHELLAGRPLSPRVDAEEFARFQVALPAQLRTKDGPLSWIPSSCRKGLLRILEADRSHRPATMMNLIPLLEAAFAEVSLRAPLGKNFGARLRYPSLQNASDTLHGAQSALEQGQVAAAVGRVRMVSLLLPELRPWMHGPFRELLLDLVWECLSLPASEALRYLVVLYRSATRVQAKGVVSVVRLALESVDPEGRTRGEIPALGWDQETQELRSQRLAQKIRQGGTPETLLGLELIHLLSKGYQPIPKAQRLKDLFRRHGLNRAELGYWGESLAQGDTRGEVLESLHQTLVRMEVCQPSAPPPEAAEPPPVEASEISFQVEAPESDPVPTPASEPPEALLEEPPHELETPSSPILELGAGDPVEVGPSEILSVIRMPEAESILHTPPPSPRPPSSPDPDLSDPGLSSKLDPSEDGLLSEDEEEDAVPPTFPPAFSDQALEALEALEGAIQAEDFDTAANEFHQLAQEGQAKNPSLFARIHSKARDFLWKAALPRPQAQRIDDDLESVSQDLRSLGYEDLGNLCDRLLVHAIPEAERKDRLPNLLERTPRSIPLLQAASRHAASEGDDSAWIRHLEAAGETFLEAGEISLASRMYMALKALDPDHPGGAKGLAKVMETAQRLSQAGQALTALEQSGIEDPTESLLELYEEFPEHFGILEAAATALELKGEKHRSAALYLRAATRSLYREEDRKAKLYLHRALSQDHEQDEALLLLALLEPLPFDIPREIWKFKVFLLEREELFEAAKYFARNALTGGGEDFQTYALLVRLTRKQKGDPGPYLGSQAAIACQEGNADLARDCLELALRESRDPMDLAESLLRREEIKAVFSPSELLGMIP